MQPNDYLEALMLGCFSIGWYWSIGCMLATGRPYGKSACFVGFTICGYCLGLAAKLWVWQAGGGFSYLVYVYGWNLTVAAIDLLLVIHYARRVIVLEAANRPTTDAKAPAHRFELHRMSMAV
ncbi:MAG: hypothetical protein AAF415_13325 [Pseudomonadota bacterium]